MHRKVWGEIHQRGSAFARELKQHKNFVGGYTWSLECMILPTV